MAYTLEHFDLHFQAGLIAQGEALFENNAVSNEEKVEKNLWSFDVKDIRIYEVEILLSSSKIKSISCDCEEFQRIKECRHIIAALFQLRMIKTKKITSSPKIVRHVPKKLSIPNILNQVNPEDLKNFIRNYAKKNKQFATALKAGFARKVEIENNAEKYESILNSIIRPATEVNHTISYQSIKQFKTISNQFDAQFEDSLSLKQYTEAFYIIKSLLSKAAYVNHWKKSENEEVIQLLKHFHKQFRLLIEMPIAPSLLQEMASFGLDLASRSYYHITHSEHNLLLILLDPPGVSSRKDTLTNILASKRKSNLLHDGEMERIWIVRQYFIEKGMPVQETKRPVLSSQAVYRIVERLQEFNASKGLLNFIDLFKINGKIKDLFLAKTYMEVLREEGHEDDVGDLVTESLFLFKDIYFYEAYKKIFPHSNHTIFKRVSEKLKAKKSFDYQKLYLDVLASDGRTEELIAYLLASKYALRHIYDRAAYIKSKTNLLTEVLIKLSDNYLSQYLGKESSNEMRKLLIYLRKNDWFKESEKLQKHILNDYEDRKSIQTDLQFF